MESEFPNNMNIRSVVLPKKWDWQTLGLTNWLTEESKTCIPLPSSCVGYESGQMIYSGCSRQKSAFSWSQETTDRQSFLRETVLWSHRRDLSALSPKLLIKCLRMKKTSDNFYETLRTTSCRFGHFYTQGKNALKP